MFADGVGEDADAGEQQREGVDPNSVRHHPAEQLQRTFQRTRIDHRQGGARKRCLLFNLRTSRSVIFFFFFFFFLVLFLIVLA